MCLGLFYNGEPNQKQDTACPQLFFTNTVIPMIPNPLNANYILKYLVFVSRLAPSGPGPTSSSSPLRFLSSAFVQLQFGPSSSSSSSFSGLPSCFAWLYVLRRPGRTTVSLQYSLRSFGSRLSGFALLVLVVLVFLVRFPLS